MSIFLGLRVSKCVPRPHSMGTHGNVLDMHIFRPASEALDQSSGGRASSICF